MIASRLPVKVLCVEFHKNPSIRQVTQAARALRGSGYVPVNLDGFEVTFLFFGARSLR